MGAIIQTLTVAVTLLIVGLSCLVIGVAGLMWKTGRDQRRVEKAANALPMNELSHHGLTEPTAVHRR
ncbi:MAG TPA: hypothetical protein VFO16_17585 [Pseudonocardiaceae bacterium]|nr:hypothetical protein [Pseudonocardiaceae bacterium]